MTTRFTILVFLLCVSCSMFSQNRFPDLDPPKTRFTQGGSERAVADDYFKTFDSLYTLLPAQPWMTDEYDRHFIPNGVVIVTEDALGDLPDLSRESYQRMRDKGINVQVIRLCLTRIGGWPGSEFNETFFERIDRHIEFGKENGIKTMFKLTLYDLTHEFYGQPGTEQWSALMNNKNGTTDKYLEAWRNIFIRYKNDPAIIGYDLLNEPLVGKTKPWDVYPEVFTDVETFEKKFFIPLYNKVVKELNKISPEKYALIQWWHYAPNDHRRIGLPSAPPVKGLKGKNIFYAPHYYGTNPSMMMERYLTDAVRLGVPIILPEYGAPTFQVTDHNIEAQLLYSLNFIKSVELYDRYSIGIVKAWWCGSGSFNAKKSDRTWAMFLGDSHAEGPERKYIMDMICRPRPLSIAGIVNSFNYDFATRIFTMDFLSGSSTMPSEIYLPVDRHYPDGCRISIADIELSITSEGRMITSENRGNSLINMFNWDADRQQLIVHFWPEDDTQYTLRIVPGVSD